MNLITERLSIESLEENTDADFIIELFNTEDFLKYIGNRYLNTIEAANNYINSQNEKFNNNGTGMMLIKIKETNEKIGICGFVKRDYLEEFDIGYALFPKYTKKGYCLEAVNAVLDYGKNLLNLLKIAAICVEENEPSVKLLKKAGFKYEKTIKKSDSELLLLYLNLD
eukprot:TRINITY_DN329_c0_g1_i1.p1 TRINITY_DN329_c0_g1~~TRINITY_DN329_c0_g1_i1.p1  ORF type:complete len:168 (-),score=33.43 TRINITY_DN329_c0_g1_i1:14-517(-)